MNSMDVYSCGITLIFDRMLQSQNYAANIVIIIGWIWQYNKLCVAAALSHVSRSDPFLQLTRERKHFCVLTLLLCPLLRKEHPHQLCRQLKVNLLLGYILDYG